MLRACPILIVLFFFSNCSPESKYRQEIGDVSNRWQEVVTHTATLSADVTQQIATWQKVYHAVYGNTDSLDTLTAEQTSELNQLKMNCLAHGDVYVSIQEELDEEMQYIESNGVGVQMLMLDLEKGDFSDSVVLKLKNVSQALVVSENKVKGWEALLSSTQKECKEACQQSKNIAL
ncbi:hypothetical protein N6H18_15230 [Reichenbachiella agarivorans]|uniref:Lipoprotein n=1 Tax=Reichenbachiella agarivorans TaxID=2979464 RepID=A0ABY6CMG7_9BACT|nr:hypothetical protein [Reichenbachiella agarivorans]UXP31701.1 hypothetical protein N6H18_15230 [Reichenbachiella agarivorans]